LIDAAMDQEALQCTPIYFYNGIDGNYYVAGNLIGYEDYKMFFGRFQNYFLANNNDIPCKHSNLHIFPNPCSEYFTILCDYDKQYCIEIYNISGIKVLSHTIYEKMASINISTLSKGVYFLRAGNQVSKLIVN
jgi:hypothetical protein